MDIPFMAIYTGLILCLFLAVLFINRKITNDLMGVSVKLYEYNGNEVNMELDISEWENVKNEKIKDCTVKDLEECKLTEAFACYKCKQALSTCTPITKELEVFDENGGSKFKIPVSKPGMGFCLRIEGDYKRDCTFKNGGRLLLIDRDSRYIYECFCTSPLIFNKSSMFSDCNQFNACLNGSIKSGWSTLEQIECECPKGTRFERLGNGVPICQKLNLFQSIDFWEGLEYKPLNRKYIDDGYIGKDLFLPNPCEFDAITGKYIGTIGEVMLMNDVAYCVSTDTRYATVAFNSDYLRNNNGKYANAVYMATEKKSPGRYTNEIVYETHTRKRNSNEYYPPISGIRARAYSILVSLPFLTNNSANIGGTGKFFNYAPTFQNTLESSGSFVYIFNAPEPIKKNIQYGSILEFGHTTVLSSGWCELANINCFTKYVGTGAYLSKTLDSDQVFVGMFSPNGTPSYTYDYLGQFKQEPIDANMDNTFLPVIVNSNGKRAINPITRRFTGTILNFTINGILYTKTLYPHDIHILQLYRTAAIDNWAPLPEKTRIYIDDPHLQYNKTYNGRFNFPDGDLIETLPEDIFGFTDKDFAIPRGILRVEIKRDKVKNNYYRFE